MLRACRRVLKPGGRIAYFNIFIAPGLSEADYQRAHRAGPSRVTSRRRDQLDLLRAAGFISVRSFDVSAQYLRTARAWIAARDRHAEELRRLPGEEDFGERLAGDRRQAELIEEGLFRRALFTARRP